jgi:hypothetical protein
LFQLIKDETPSSSASSLDYVSFITSWSEHEPLAQSSHLQDTPQEIPALKHSQYFFWHWLFLQLHPLPWFCLLADLVFSLMAFLALSMQSAWSWSFEHP